MRVDPEVKKRAEEVLSQIGMPMSTAIDIYLKQIAMIGGIPFAVTLPKVPLPVNADLMTSDDIHAKLNEGYSDMEEIYYYIFEINLFIGEHYERRVYYKTN